MVQHRSVWHMKTMADHYHTEEAYRWEGEKARMWEVQAEVDHTQRRGPHHVRVSRKRKHALSNDQHSEVNIAITYSVQLLRSQTCFRHRWPPSKITLPLIEIETDICSDIVRSPVSQRVEFAIGVETMAREWPRFIEHIHRKQEACCGVTRLESVRCITVPQDLWSRWNAL